MLGNSTYVSTALWYQQVIRIFWFIAIALIMFTDKLSFHKKINGLNSHILDLFMKNYTHLGDGIFAIVLSLYFIFRNVRIGLLILISYLTSSGITQVLKHFFFSEYNRPYFYFKEDSAFHFIENFNYHAHHSFPSGHATTCFAIFTILAYKNQENIRVQIIFAILAISVAFSRVYLSQHFIQDIIAGSMIGFLCAHFLWLFIYSKLYKLDRALLPKKQNVVKEK